jgi:flagellar biosynthesis component FlhA
MSPVLKILVGALMMVLGIFTSITYSNELVNVVQGALGPLLVLIGAFIVWLESDELKVQREEKQEEKQRQQQEQRTLKQQTQSNEPRQETREAAREIKQAVSSTPDPEQILEGTVQEVREEVSERDDLDVQELLEAEKQGKNRKTLVNYLERRLD